MGFGGKWLGLSACSSMMCLLSLVLVCFVSGAQTQLEDCPNFKGDCVACSVHGCNFCVDDLSCSKDIDDSCQVWHNGTRPCPEDLCSNFDGDCYDCTATGGLDCSFCPSDLSCRMANTQANCSDPKNNTGLCSRCRYSSCSDCVEDPECGWCEGLGVCFAGTPDSAIYNFPNEGPKKGITCPSGWQFSVCSACSANLDCTSCYDARQSGCRWCYSQKRCLHKDEGSSCSLVTNCHETQIKKLKDGIAVFWLVLTGSCIFFMQCGFVMLETGSIRVKNTKNILFQNSIDMCIACICYYLIGYGFAFGGRNCPFMGLGSFALHEVSNYHHVFFQFCFLAASVTIISGATTERIKFEAYMIICVLMSTIVYPIVSHWFWSPNGWLQKMDVIDFAGSAVVHMTGGYAGLVASASLGPRMGRFVKGKPYDFPGHSVALSAVGTLLLWFCWYSFNPGSSGTLTDGSYLSAARAALNSTLSPSVSGLVTFFYFKLRFHEYNLYRVFNATLAGLAAVTSPCAVIDAYCACVVGLLTAIAIEWTSRLLEFLHIDDPADAFSVHGGGGVVGMIASGLFARQEFIATARNKALENVTAYGLLYGGGARLLGIQLLGVVVVIAWVTVWVGALCFILGRFKMLRVTKHQEEQGIDKYYHGGFAYNPLEVKVALWVGQKQAH